MRNDILEQAQEIRTSIDNVTGTMADADAAKNPMLFLPCLTQMCSTIFHPIVKCSFLRHCTITGNLQQTGQPTQVKWFLYKRGDVHDYSDNKRNQRCCV